MHSQQLVTLLEMGIIEENMAWFHDEFLPVVVRRLSILSDQEHEVFLMSGTFLYSFLCSESDAASYLYNNWGRVNKYDLVTPPEVCYYMVKYRKLQLATQDSRKFDEVKVIDPRPGWLAKFEADVDYTKRINFKTQTFHVGKSNDDNAKLAQIRDRNYKRSANFTKLEVERLKLIALHQHYVHNGGEFIDIRRSYNDLVKEYFYGGNGERRDTELWFLNMDRIEGVYHGVAYNPGLVLPIGSYKRSTILEDYLESRFQENENITCVNVPKGTEIDSRGVHVFEQVDPITVEQFGFEEEDNYVYDYEVEQIEYEFDPITFTGEFELHMLNKLREIFADEKVQEALHGVGLKNVSIVSTKVHEQVETYDNTSSDVIVEEKVECSHSITHPADLDKGAILVGLLAAVSGFTPGATASPYYSYGGYYPTSYRTYSSGSTYSSPSYYYNNNYNRAYYDYFYSLNPKGGVTDQSQYYYLVKRSEAVNGTDDLSLVVKTQPYYSDLMLNSSTAAYLTDSAHEGVQDRRVFDSSAANGLRLTDMSYGLGLLMWFACGFM